MPPNAQIREPYGFNRPIVRRAIESAVAETGVDPLNIIGRNRRHTRPVVAARRKVIVDLYGQPCGRDSRYGIAEIGRVLGLHHASVYGHLKKAGLK